jgi:uncharacterized UPF0160 family protein
MAKLKVVTHNSTFHADDVFGVAVVALVHGGLDALEVTRTRDESIIAAADIVLDVGGIHDPKARRFDHHQQGAGVRENNLPYAAFGLLWKEFGPEICGDEAVAADVESRLVMANDALDNGVEVSTALYDGVKPYDLGAYVSAHNLTWREEEEFGATFVQKQDEAFITLVPWAMKLIEREVRRSKDKLAAAALVRAAYDAAEDKRIVVLDQYYPYQDVIENLSEPLFVVYPNKADKTWCAKAVRKDSISYGNRLDFPAAWASKRDADMAAVSGVPDAIFCHTKLFLAVARSKEGAIELARKAVEAA